MIARSFRGTVLAGALFAASVAQAQDAAGVRVEGAWARASAGAARNGAAYMTIRNDGKTADRLVAASSPAAGKVELHTHLKDGEVMRMRQVMTVEIAPGTPAVMQPGGLHVMLLDLKAPLKDGERFPITLNFEKAGPMTVNVEIRRTPPAGAGHGHSGS